MFKLLWSRTYMQMLCLGPQQFEPGCSSLGLAVGPGDQSRTLGSGIRQWRSWLGQSTRVPQRAEPCGVWLPVSWADQTQCMPRSVFTHVFKQRHFYHHFHHCPWQYYLAVAKISWLQSNSVARIDCDALRCSKLVYCTLKCICRCTFCVFLIKFNMLVATYSPCESNFKIRALVVLEFGHHSRNAMFPLFHDDNTQSFFRSAKRPAWF